MAFLPHPALPVAPHRSSQVRVSIRAAADGAISVSRRRRVYEFLSATSGTGPAASPKSTVSPASAPESSDGVSTEAPALEEVREDLITRMTEREAAIKADAANKAALWKAELDALRTPPVQVHEVLPEPVEEEQIVAEPVPSYYPSRSSATATLFGADDVAAKAPAEAAPATVGYAPPKTASPVPRDLPSSAESEGAPVAVAAAGETQAPSRPESSVSDLYTSPAKVEASAGDVGARDLNPLERLQEMVEDVVEAVEDVVEDVRDVVEDVVDDVIEAITPDEEKLAEAKPPKKKGAPEPVPEPEPLGAKEDRSIGEVILDAIVEGVPTPEPEPEPVKPAVDKSDLIQLIDSGKVKNLTVTKLRRLLSQNGLKTSGRKAELIARLTSYAKAK